MINDACITRTKSKKILLKDANNRSAIIVNDSETYYYKVRVDACAIIGGIRADWAIENKNSVVIVELKGKNVEHAADQVFRTAEIWRDVFKRSKNFGGLIVASQYPKSSTSIQIKQNRFAKVFAGPLHVVTKNDEFLFENLISFKGPRRKD